MDIISVVRNEFSAILNVSKAPIRLGDLKHHVEDKYAVRLQFDEVRKAAEKVYNQNLRVRRKPFSNGRYVEFEYFLLPEEAPKEGFFSQVKAYLFKLDKNSIIAYDSKKRVEPYVFNSGDKLAVRKKYRTLNGVKGVVKHEDVRMVKVETYLKNEIEII
jgi:hypothetical protein